MFIVESVYDRKEGDSSYGVQCRESLTIDPVVKFLGAHKSKSVFNPNLSIDKQQSFILETPDP